jgi:hypothetical protein
MREPQRMGEQSTAAGAGVVVLLVLMVEVEAFEVECDMLDLMSNRRAVVEASETGCSGRSKVRQVSFSVFRSVSRCARVSSRL